MNFTSAPSILRAAGVEIDVGLTPAEFDSIEHKFNLRLPPDLREFLSIGLPVSRAWVEAMYHLLWVRRISDSQMVLWRAMWRATRSLA